MRMREPKKPTMKNMNFTICLAYGLMLAFMGSAYGDSREIRQASSSYKYELEEEYRYRLSFNTNLSVAHESIVLEDDILILLKGFDWDGASGPAIDTKNVLRASAVHDALGSLMNRNLLDRSRFKKLSDDEFAIILKEDGMPATRIWYMRRAVGLFGNDDPVNRSKLAASTLSMNASFRGALQNASLKFQAIYLGKEIRELKVRPAKVAFPANKEEFPSRG
jgi:GGDEF domain-containing protein